VLSGALLLYGVCDAHQCLLECRPVAPRRLLHEQPPASALRARATRCGVKGSGVRLALGAQQSSPVIRGCELYFRGDAAFASPGVYEYLEQNHILYATRLPANQVLSRDIEHLMTRPVGRPPKRPRVFYHDFSYQATSWSTPRRVIAKVEWHAGELFPRVGFIVTNMTAKAKNVVRFYNKRGNCEQWIKEGKRTLTWTRLSCTRFSSNQVRLALFVLAYNLGNFFRRFALPSQVSHWSLSSIQLKLIKIGAKVMSHSRRTIFQMAEVAVPEALFAALLERIRCLVAAPT